MSALGIEPAWNVCDERNYQAKDAVLYSSLWIYFPLPCLSLSPLASCSILDYLSRTATTSTISSR